MTIFKKVGGGEKGLAEPRTPQLHAPPRGPQSLSQPGQWGADLGIQHPTRLCPSPALSARGWGTGVTVTQRGPACSTRPAKAEQRRIFLFSSETETKQTWLGTSQGGHGGRPPPLLGVRGADGAGRKGTWDVNNLKRGSPQAPSLAGGGGLEPGTMGLPAVALTSVAVGSPGAHCSSRGFSLLFVFLGVFLFCFFKENKNKNKNSSHKEWRPDRGPGPEDGDTGQAASPRPVVPAEAPSPHTRLYSLRFSCRMVSFTAANTKRMFSVSVAQVKWE